VQGILLENPARDENVEMLIWRKNRRLVLTMKIRENYPFYNLKRSI